MNSSSSDGLQYSGRNAGAVGPRPKHEHRGIDSVEIEKTLLGHPNVGRVLVAIRKGPRGERKPVAYVVPKATWSGSAEPAASGEQLDEWQQVYDMVYADSPEVELGEDFGVWTSLYTGAPIPMEQMRAWRDAAVDQVTRWSPRTVLELGVGSGLLLARVASGVEEYWGTDFSAVVIDRLGSQVAASGLSNRVRLRCQAADDMTGLPRDFFDTVVLNSLVQYFPSETYLDRVLTRAWDLLPAHGRVIVGDVRRNGSLRLLQTAVQGARHPQLSPAVRSARAEQAIAAEKELLIEPEWFSRWAAARETCAAEIRLKPGDEHNELTRHRYEVVLHKEPTELVTLDDAAPGVTWGRDLERLGQVADLVSRRAGRPVRICGVPNARLASEADEAGLPPLFPAAAGTTTCVDPQHLRDLAVDMGWEAVLTWSAQGIDRFDVVLLPDGPMQNRAVSVSLPPPPADAERPLVNDPMAAREFEALPEALRRYAGEWLPEHMVPTAVVLVAEIPPGLV
ncbi:methyltransferase domain-containing protein [Streptomyces sp. NPDC051172]|uniref:methyltransferase domain-containing protein n=1 Tax=Streptomyces sp. NPDC051172 TaxID=3155796 RepID=UPI003440C3DD